MKIPFAKPILDKKELNLIKEVLDSGILVHGKKADMFEKKFSSLVNSKYSTSVSSCTAGMHLFYFVNNIKKGDEVIVPSQTHVATAHAVELTGAKPVFVDSSIENGNIDVKKIENQISKKTKAIAVVHYLGLPVEMKKVRELAKKYNLKVIEDCALSLGSLLNNKHTGLHSDAGFFSFYPVKHITSAEGGMIISNNKELIKKMSLAKAFGVNKNHNQRTIFGMYDAIELGFNYRMSEIHAAIGIEQINKFKTFIKKRKKNFDYFSKLLKTENFGRVLNINTSRKVNYSPYCLTYLINKKYSKFRNSIIADLREEGIGSSIYYPKPVPMMYYDKKKYKTKIESYLNAKIISESSISLPIGPHINNFKIDYIYDKLTKIIKKYGN